MKGRTVSILGLVGQVVCHKHSPALQQNPAPDEACRKESGHVPTEIWGQTFPPYRLFMWHEYHSFGFFFFPQSFENVKTSLSS